jgi:hypothetical protein
VPEARVAPPKLPSYIRDHRKRLRERFLEGGATAVPDYELLELVLFGALPRQDVKPLARSLIEAFGDFNGVSLRRGPSASREVCGVGRQRVVLPQGDRGRRAPPVPRAHPWTATSSRAGTRSSTIATR